MAPTSTKLPALLLALLLCASATGDGVPSVFAQDARASTTDAPYVVDYYYKAQWGHADEFIRLFRKNHFPVLKKEMELGRILRVSAVSPRFHGTEDGRWDYRVTITWKNVGVTADGFDASTITRQLYPDQETFRREEQRRFEILLAHWDVPVADVNLEQ